MNRRSQRVTLAETGTCSGSPRTSGGALRGHNLGSFVEAERVRGHAVAQLALQPVAPVAALLPQYGRFS